MRGARNIYFLAPVGGGKVKIGWSSYPPRRLRDLLLWSPVDLELLASVPGTQADENFLHEMFRASWWRREWFHSTPEMLAAIDLIRLTGELPPKFRAPIGWAMKRMPGHGKPGSSEAQRRIWANMNPEERAARCALLRRPKRRQRIAA